MVPAIDAWWNDGMLPGRDWIAATTAAWGSERASKISTSNKEKKRP
jgi:hypothetical protein